MQVLQVGVPIQQLMTFPHETVDICISSAAHSAAPEMQPLAHGLTNSCGTDFRGGLLYPQPIQHSVAHAGGHLSDGKSNV